MISDLELGWLVGILEGEGYFGFGSRTRVVEVTMTDEDTMCRLAVIFERITGRSYDLKPRNDRRPNRQQAYRLLASGDDAIKIMKLVVKHMSHRRRQRIWRSINGFTVPKMIVSKELVNLPASLMPGHITYISRRK